MGELGGFLRVERHGFVKRDPRERVKDYKQYFDLQPEEELRRQGGRCMDCGIPFCHEGCPLGNLIPDWNDLVYRGLWREALDQLHATNNFPEFTGRICPAPCESACVLDINADPVTIEQIEMAIADKGFEEGWIRPEPPASRTGKSVGVVGSGPAGLAVAAELNKRGHHVVVYERDEGLGGLLRFGVPDAKLEKRVIDRRTQVLEAEGVEFRLGVDVGRDIAAEQLRAAHDAVIVAIGSRVHRDLEVPGRGLAGVHFAMDYLYTRNRAVAAMEGREARQAADPIVAKGKRVVVIGGGDTGMDCLSNAIREGATEARMLDVYQELPASGRDARSPWPLPPKRTLTTYALEEGGEREWATEVFEILGEGGAVAAVRARKVKGTSSRDLKPVPGTEETILADLVLVAIGFSHPEHEGCLEQLGVDLDPRGNVRTRRTFRTSEEGVFACGDARIGQSLVVTAIAEGRRCARVVDRYLGGAKLDADVARAVARQVPNPERGGFAVGEEEHHVLREEAETAGTVVMGDDFFSGPGAKV